MEKYADWMKWNSQLINYTTGIIEDAILSARDAHSDQRTFDYYFDPDFAVDVSSRPKNLDSTVRKLQHMGTTPLERMVDIAGLRVDGNFTLQGQDVLSDFIAAELIKSGAEEVKVLDRRLDPKNGYRAVHLNIKSSCGLAEVQIRTSLQAKWANLSEIFGDIAGKNVRYDVKITEEWSSTATAIQQISDNIYEVEKYMSETSNLSITAPRNVDNILASSGLRRDDLPIDRRLELENSLHQVNVGNAGVARAAENMDITLESFAASLKVLRAKKINERN